jgi:uncharacterized membrane protein HdeD (DUF308 family)
MVTLILVILLAFFAFIESTAYSIYEIKINQNKMGGICLLILSFVGLIFPIVSFFNS